MKLRPSFATLAIVVIFTAVLISGCGHLREAGPSDRVSGHYDGNWYGPNVEQPLGELSCVIVRRDGETWDATFSASFGGFGEYDLRLEGRRDGDKVVFGGSIDLGETSGGVFDWSGEIRDELFTGSYSSRFISGTFRMTKTSPEAAAR